eukprot:3418185-Rhodomonas_salina.2
MKKPTERGLRRTRSTSSLDKPLMTGASCCAPITPNMLPLKFNSTSVVFPWRPPNLSVLAPRTHRSRTVHTTRIGGVPGGP